MLSANHRASSKISPNHPGMYFFKIILLYLMKISLNYVPRGPIDLTWHWFPQKKKIVAEQWQAITRTNEDIVYRRISVNFIGHKAYAHISSSFLNLSILKVLPHLRRNNSWAHINVTSARLIREWPCNVGKFVSPWGSRCYYFYGHLYCL